MWTISSNNVQQVKDQIERRRIEIEARYTDEKRALDAERAAIETLERVAADFAQRHFPDDPSDPPQAAVEADIVPASETMPAEAEPTENRPDHEIASPPVAELDAAAGETNLAFDILKPGSRWRLNRAARLLNPDSAPSSSSST